MSKLKKIMFTGTVIIVLLVAQIIFINQSTPAQSQTVQIASGATPLSSTAWQSYSDGQGGEGIFVDVNTSSGGFTTTPIYTTSLGGLGYQWLTAGATSIYTPTPTGFRVYVQWSTGGGGLTPTFANNNGWHINWIGVSR
jgi:hypothetical protein